MNLVYAGNRKVFKGILLSLLSVVKHSSDALNVFIITMDLQDMNPNYEAITSKECSILGELVKSKNPVSRVIKLDATDIYKKTLRGTGNTTFEDTRFTPYSLIKLYLDEVNNIPDRLIYLDTDTLIMQDLKQIDSLNIEDYQLAAARNTIGAKDIISNKHYFNSGVMYLNMKLIKESGLFKSCRALIAKSKFKKPDQEALNKMAISVYRLDGAFNEQGKITKNTVVKHFATGLRVASLKSVNMKSWDVDKIHAAKIHDFDDIFVQYENINKKYGLDDSIMLKTIEN